MHRVGLNEFQTHSVNNRTNTNE